MKSTTFISTLILLLATLLTYAQRNDSTMLRTIYTEALTQGQCYQTLDYISNKIGGRLSGSPQAAKAVAYTFAQMQQMGFDTVYLQEVMVPHWVRGEKEIGFFSKAGKQTRVRICALGNSVGTGTKGIRAPVVEVHNFKELKNLGTAGVNGKIVFFNRSMNPEHIHTGRAYGEAGDQRGIGPAEAAGRNCAQPNLGQ
jgi:carboxypeptidase Q